MPENRTCPQCGTPLPVGALGGLCPACLLQQGAVSDTATQPPTPPFIPPPVEEVARLFPELEILRLLGKGGMGAVYQARQPALDRMVALKILPYSAQPSADAGFAERFTREARALGRLAHPNIVAVHEFGQKTGLHYFIMEFVDGVNLRQLQQSGRLSPREALQIIPQLCDALQYAHDQGIVHRDIKPENVLMDRKGRVKIADFGLAKIIGADPLALRLTGEGHRMGTPHYMSPEQVERPLEVDHRADIYSLGVVFYEMLTGELPLGRFAPPSRKVEIDVRLDDVVLRALEKEPERRYQQASDVKTRLEAITQTPGQSTGQSPRANPPTQPEANSQPVAQSVRVPAIAMTLFGMLICLFYFTRGSDGLSTFLHTCSGIIGGFLIVAGLKMMRQESYYLALVGGVLCMLNPMNSWVGVAVGAWVLFVLTRPSVQETFKIVKPARPPLKLRFILKIPMLIAALLLLLLAVFFGRTLIPSIAWHHAARLGFVPATNLYWSPPLVPGAKPSPSAIYQEGKKLASEGQYEEALQRYLWFWNHAAQYDAGQGGLRGSFLLSDWIDLSHHYSKAREALVEIRDADHQVFDNGRGYFALFQDVFSLNQYLKDEPDTITLFKSLRQKDPDLAAQCFPVIEPLLIKKGEYAFCLNFIPDPQAAFDGHRSMWERNKEMEARSELTRRESQNRMDEMYNKMRKEHPDLHLPPPFKGPDMTAFNNTQFINQTRELIEILIGTGQQDQAEKIQTQAVALLDDPRLKSAVTDAQKAVAAQEQKPKQK